MSLLSVLLRRKDGFKAFSPFLFKNNQSCPQMETEQEKILPFNPIHVSTIPIPAADELLASAAAQDVREGDFSDADLPASPLSGIGTGRETEALAQAMRDFGGGLGATDG